MSVLTRKPGSWKKNLARTGLISKGIVYCLLGILAFMAAFEISGQSNNKADKQGVFEVVQEQTGGNIILALITIGLICYSAWRVIEAFSASDGEKKSLAKRARYLFSGLIYLSLAAYAIKLLAGKQDDGGKNSTQELASQLLDKPFGQWMIAIAAVCIAAVGIYQGYYGIAGKYKKHVTKLHMHSASATVMLRAGRIGYVSRAVVWLLIAFLLLKAALHSNSDEAGNTGNAFDYLERSPFGSYLLAILALGLICYGVFNFIRARYDTFG